MLHGIVSGLVIVYLAMAEPIPESARDTVAYVVLPGTPDGSRKATPIGTAFFVATGYPGVKDKVWVYLVTARHVLFDEQKRRHPKLLLRVNDKEFHRAKDLDVLRTEEWFFHERPDEVDIAVHPLLPSEADFKFVTNNDFVTDELITKKRIGIGDDLFYLGLLSYDADSDRISPVARFGHLALTPNGPTLDGRAYHFIDANNMPGHSGSPVFLWATAARSSSQLVASPRIFGLYGVVSGVVEYQKDLKARAPKETSGTNIPIDYRSAGLTAVVPVKYLVEILNRKELRSAVGAP